MKKYKKIGLGLILSLAVVLLSAVVGLSHSHQVAAAGSPSVQEAQECSDPANLKFTDVAHIVCTLSDGSKITFIDSDPTDTGANIVNLANYEPSASNNSFCAPTNGKPLTYSFSGSKGQIYPGITVLGVDTVNPSTAASGKTLALAFNFPVTPSGSNACEIYQPPNNKTGIKGGGASITGAATANAPALLQFQGTPASDGSSNDGMIISPPDDLSSNSALEKESFKLTSYQSSNPNKFVYLSSDFDSTKCSGDALVVTTGSPSTAIALKIDKDTNGVTKSDYPELETAFEQQNLNIIGCGVSGIDSFSFNGWNGDPPMQISGTAPTATSVVAAGKAGNTGSTVCAASATNTCPPADSGNASCVVGSNNSIFDLKSDALSWILCPIISGVSSFANSINDLVSSQLDFNISANLTGANSNVQEAWSIFKDLASAMVVILMLVMVIGQAVNAGPFDAYTVKKLLPKLVIAVIAMQLSWDLCIWLISLANDAGQGIAQLMAAPFGGQSALDLPSLLHRLSPTLAAQVSAGGIGLLFASPLLLFLFWPGVLIALFLMAMNLIIALCTLLLRNALIILLVITSPLAFLLWATPGSTMQNWWKKWSENFTKILLFFPMVMGMIYGGRIFAWVAGNLGTAGPLDLLMVMIGFFGPYYFLPKTFRWGGSLMSQASQAVNSSKALQKTREKGLEFGKSIDQDWRGKQVRSGVFGYMANDKRLARFMPKKIGLAEKDAETGKRPRSKLGLPKLQLQDAVKTRDMTEEEKKNEKLKKAGVHFDKVTDPATGKQVEQASKDKQGRYLDSNGKKVFGKKLNVDDNDIDSRLLLNAGVMFKTNKTTGKLEAQKDANGNYINKEGAVVQDSTKFGMDKNGVLIHGRAKLDGKVITGNSKLASLLFPAVEGRLIGRVASLKLMPTAKGRAEAIQFGADYAERMNNLAKIDVHRRFQEGTEHGYNGFARVAKMEPVPVMEAEVDKQGRKTGRTIQTGTRMQEVTDDFGHVVYEKDAKGKDKWVAKHWDPGVQAAKQASIDAVGDTNLDGRLAKMALDDALTTRSWPEIEDTVITKGPHAGKKVYEVPEVWDALVTEKPEHYVSVQQNEYHLTPDVMQLKYPNSPDGRALAARAGRKVGDRLSPADRMIYAADKRMKPDLLAGQKEGFWKFAIQSIKEERGKKTPAGTQTADDLARTLAHVLEEMAHNGSEGAGLLAKMHSGQITRSVNEVLKIVKPGLTFDDFLAVNKLSQRGDVNTNLDMDLPKPARKGAAAEPGHEDDTGGPEPEAGAVSRPPTRQLFPNQAPATVVTTAAAGHAQPGEVIVAPSQAGQAQEGSLSIHHELNKTMEEVAMELRKNTHALRAAQGIREPVTIESTGPVRGDSMVGNVVIAPGTTTTVQPTHVYSGGAPAAAAPAAAPAVGRSADLSRSNIGAMDEAAANQWIQERGGTAHLSNEDLTALYNGVRGAVQQSVREELQRRGQQQTPPVDLFGQGPALPG